MNSYWICNHSHCIFRSKSSNGLETHIRLTHRRDDSIEQFDDCVYKMGMSLMKKTLPIPIDLGGHGNRLAVYRATCQYSLPILEDEEGVRETGYGLLNEEANESSVNVTCTENIDCKERKFVDTIIEINSKCGAKLTNQFMQTMYSLSDHLTKIAEQFPSLYSVNLFNKSDLLTPFKEDGFEKRVMNLSSGKQTTWYVRNAIELLKIPLSSAQKISIVRMQTVDSADTRVSKIYRSSEKS